MATDDIRIHPYNPGNRGQLLELNEVVLRDLDLFEGEGPDFEDLEFEDLRDVESSYLEPGGAFLVAELANDIVAMGGFYPVETDVAKLRRMRVMPEWQAEGIGRRMLATLEAAARKRGFVEMTLDTAVEQTDARQFYRRNGYERTHFAKFEGFDSVFYRKRLDSETQQ